MLCGPAGPEMRGLVGAARVGRLAEPALPGEDETVLRIAAPPGEVAEDGRRDENAGGEPCAAGVEEGPGRRGSLPVRRGGERRSTPFFARKQPEPLWSRRVPEDGLRPPEREPVARGARQANGKEARDEPRSEGEDAGRHARF